MKADTVKKSKILIGCFLTHLLIAGASRLSSIYFVESITRYNANRKQASFPFVLAFMVKTLSGPLTGYFEQILGTQRLITIGCLIATLSIGGCFFAEDILTVTLLWGVILGLSFGFVINMQAPLLSQHFKRSKSRANSFVLVGSSIGGILLPIMVTNFIEAYGASGSFLVLSAIIAHSIPASFLLKNPITNTLENSPNANIEVLNKNDSKSNQILANFSNKDEYLCMEQTHKSQTSSTAPNVSSKDLSVTNSTLDNNPEKSSKLSTYNSPSKASLPNVTRKQKERKNVDTFFKKEKYTFRSFRIFIDPTFILILIIIGLNSVVLIVVWTIILDFVRDKGVPESLEIYYVILLPITDILGRIGSGYIADKNFLTSSNFCFFTFLTMAISLISIVHVKHFILIMAFEMILSICLGIAIVLQVTITDDFMEEEFRKMSQSCKIMLYAPLSLAISPIIGYFRGGYGSYDYVFYILSGASLFCGCSACLLPSFAKRRQPA